MEKNDVQSGGQDPVPKQLFSSLIYSTGHLVRPLNKATAHPNPIHKTSGKRKMNHWVNMFEQPSLTSVRRPYNT